MKVLKIICEAIFECEFCGNKFESYGYESFDFYNSEISYVKCKSCGKSSNSESPVLRNSEASA